LSSSSATERVIDFEEGQKDRLTVMRSTRFYTSTNPPSDLKRIIKIMARDQPLGGYATDLELRSKVTKASRHYGTPGLRDDAVRFLQLHGVILETEDGRFLIDVEAGDRLRQAIADGHAPAVPSLSERAQRSRELMLASEKITVVSGGRSPRLTDDGTVLIEPEGELEEDQLTLRDVAGLVSFEDVSTLELDPSFPFLLGLELMPLVPILEDPDMAKGLSDEELTNYHAALLLQAQNSTAMAQKAEEFLWARAEAAEQKRLAAEKAAEAAAMDAALEAQLVLQRIQAEATKAEAEAEAAQARAKRAQDAVTRQTAEVTQCLKAIMGRAG